MKKIILFFVLFVINSSYLFSQEIYICSSYTEDGKPVGPVNKLEIKPYGTAVYILFDSKKEIEDPILYMFIDKLTDDSFKPFDSKTISVKKEDTWAVTSFEFTEPGTYDIYFLNSSQHRLASMKFNTYFGEEYTNKVISPSTSYNGECEFVFCELVINGKPVNQLNTLSIKQTEGQVFIYLNNHSPFDIDVIKVQFWKSSESDSNYEQLIDSKKFQILPEWPDTFFKYNFSQTGEYKIDIYDTDDNFICSNVLTVIN